MRIAFFVDAFPVITETFIVNQITGLLDRGHDVDIFARWAHSDPRVHPDIARYRLLDRTCYLNATQSKVARIARGVAHIGAIATRRRGGIGLIARIAANRGRVPPFNTLALLRVAARELAAGRYDVIHCQYATLGRSLVALRRLGVCRGALVTSIRGHDITQKDKQAPGFYAELFREGDLFLPVSRSLEAYLLALGCPPEKSVVHHSGIDLSRLPWRARTRRPGERTVIVTVGRMVEMKGLAYGIEAVARLVEAGLDVEYHMIGAGPLKDELVALVRRLGIEDRVHMHGGIPHDQVLSLLDRAHLMLAPSVTAANGEAEGIPNAVKEGMATGLPVVATRNSGIPELVADGVSGYLVPERDAAALAERLQWLCEHDECWEAMGRAGRARVEQEYARDALNDELVQWYERLVRRAEASDGASQNNV